MGEHMTNLPTRFPADTLSLIVRESAFHKMKPSQYVREAMKKWFRMVADGTVQFLDVSMQEEHSLFCEQREQTSQVSAAFPGEQKKPPVRRVIGDVAGRGRTITHFNRKDVANQASGITPFRQLQHIHFTPLNESAA